MKEYPTGRSAGAKAQEIPKGGGRGVEGHNQ